MIKSLFEADEDNSLETKPTAENEIPAETFVEKISSPQFSEADDEQSKDFRDSSEIYDELNNLAPEFWNEPETAGEMPNIEPPPVAETEELSNGETINAALPAETANETETFSFPAAPDETVNSASFGATAANSATINFESPAKAAAEQNGDFLQKEYSPETTAETIRKSGLAYAAAIILFGSIVFTMLLGWFADLLLGSSPWGVVAGIVLGSIVGFTQFFRMTSQILKNKD